MELEFSNMTSLNFTLDKIANVKGPIHELELLRIVEWAIESSAETWIATHRRRPTLMNYFDVVSCLTQLQLDTHVTMHMHGLQNDPAERKIEAELKRAQVQIKALGSYDWKLFIRQSNWPTSYTITSKLECVDEPAKVWPPVSAEKTFAAAGFLPFAMPEPELSWDSLPTIGAPVAVPVVAESTLASVASTVEAVLTPVAAPVHMVTTLPIVVETPVAAFVREATAEVEAPLTIADEKVPFSLSKYVPVRSGPKSNKCDWWVCVGGYVRTVDSKLDAEILVIEGDELEIKYVESGEHDLVKVDEVCLSKLVSEGHRPKRVRSIDDVLAWRSRTVPVLQRTTA